MKYKVGDRVRISDAGKKEFSDHESNPYDGVGEITGKGSWLAHKVSWDNGEFNTYDPEHLELACDKPAADLTLSVDIPTQAMKEFADHCERAAAALERIKEAMK